MSEQTATGPVNPDRPAPRIGFSDDQINKYLPDGVEGMNVGDTVTLTLKGKVVELSKSEEPDYETAKDGETPKLKLHRRVKIELVGESKSDKGWDDQKRRLGKNAVNTMRQVGIK